MEFMLSNEYELCRKDGNTYATFIIGNVWGSDDYADDVFNGYEHAFRVTEQEAIEFMIKDRGLSREEGKKLLHYSCHD